MFDSEYVATQQKTSHFSTCIDLARFWPAFGETKEMKVGSVDANDGVPFHRLFRKQSRWHGGGGGMNYGVSNDGGYKIGTKGRPSSRAFQKAFLLVMVRT